MELAKPLLAEVLADLADAAHLEELVVLPLFIAGGLHWQHDIEAPLKAFAAGQPGLSVRVLPPLAAQPGFVDYLAGLAGDENA